MTAHISSLAITPLQTGVFQPKKTLTIQVFIGRRDGSCKFNKMREKPIVPLAAVGKVRGELQAYGQLLQSADRVLRFAFRRLRGG
jgi:hypothetical protein